MAFWGLGLQDVKDSDIILSDEKKVPGYSLLEKGEVANLNSDTGGSSEENTPILLNPKAIKKNGGCTTNEVVWKK